MRPLPLLLGAALAWPLAVNAQQQQQIDYNYIQADWIADGEIDAGALGDDDYDGWSLEASGSLTPNLFLLGEYSDLSFDDGGDGDTTTLGLGMRGPIHTAANRGQADIFGMVSYERLDSAIGDADGFGLTAGARWQPMMGMEINPSLAYVDYGEVDGTSVDIDGWRFALRGIFNLTDRVALNAEWRTNRLEADGGGVDTDFDLENEIRLGARMYWM